jgi:hypothetical protein
MYSCNIDQLLRSLGSFAILLDFLHHVSLVHAAFACNCVFLFILSVPRELILVLTLSRVLRSYFLHETAFMCSVTVCLVSSCHCT